jgi:hypothetical protein
VNVLTDQQVELLEQVVRRHLMREYADRNRFTYIKPLPRADIRDAIKALRTIKKEVEYVD